jgi:hypothetical protein
VPRQIVSDNLKSGITKACFYEPTVNRTYADMAAHYRTAIIPARPYKPRDKAKVEVGVQVVQRWILARLRNRPPVRRPYPLPLAPPDPTVVICPTLRRCDGCPLPCSRGLALWRGAARRVRSDGGLVIWVHHDGPPGNALEPGTNGWDIFPALEQCAEDATIRKTACDSFLGTDLEALLRAKNPDRVIITGWATDFCVDTTVRSCTARGFNTWVAADGHTVSDRPHLPATKIIERCIWVQ